MSRILIVTFAALDLSVRGPALQCLPSLSHRGDPLILARLGEEVHPIEDMERRERRYDRHER